MNCDSEVKYLIYCPFHRNMQACFQIFSIFAFVSFLPFFMTHLFKNSCSVFIKTVVHVFSFCKVVFPSDFQLGSVLFFFSSTLIVVMLNKLK